MIRKRFGRYRVDVKREDKVFFPGAKITKGEVIHHFQAVADQLLPHVRRRPLTLQRFPDGISEEGFYQKEAPDYFPDWIHRVRVPLESGDHQEQVMVSNTAGLTYLANQGVVTLHTWLSRSDELEAPDRMVFDLDPADEGFEPVRKAAHRLRDLLEALGLRPFLMTTGSRGAHVWVPIRRGPDFDEVRAFARKLADHLAGQFPESLTTEVRKAKRKGRLFIDVARNAFGQTAVAPYSIRPRPGAPAATPLDWAELDNPKLGSGTHTLRSLPRRLGQKGDPWKGMGRHGSKLAGAEERLATIREAPGHA